MQSLLLRTIYFSCGFKWDVASIKCNYLVFVLKSKCTACNEDQLLHKKMCKEKSDSLIFTSLKWESVERENPQLLCIPFQAVSNLIPSLQQFPNFPSMTVMGCFQCFSVFLYYGGICVVPYHFLCVCLSKVGRGGRGVVLQDLLLVRRPR